MRKQSRDLHLSKSQVGTCASEASRDLQAGDKSRLGSSPLKSALYSREVLVSVCMMPREYGRSGTRLATGTPLGALSTNNTPKTMLASTEETKMDAGVRGLRDHYDAKSLTVDVVVVFAASHLRDCDSKLIPVEHDNFRSVLASRAHVFLLNLLEFMETEREASALLAAVCSLLQYAVHDEGEATQRVAGALPRLLSFRTTSPEMQLPLLELCSGALQDPTRTSPFCLCLASLAS